MRARLAAVRAVSDPEKKPDRIRSPRIDRAVRIMSQLMAVEPFLRECRRASPGREHAVLCDGE